MSDTSWYVQRGRVIFGAFPSYAAAGREANTEAGGVVTDHVEEGCTVIPLDKLSAWKEMQMQVNEKPLVATADGELIDDLTPINQLTDDWEELTMAGLAASEGQERRRWYLGDLAQRVARKYGAKSLKSFAGDIKIPKVATLRDYERAARFYPFNARAEYPELTWSHYREAIRAGELELAMEWLEKANNNKWNVVRLGQAISKTQGKTVTVRHKYDVEPVNYGQGRITVGTTDLDVKDYLECLTEGRSRDDFAVQIVVSWQEREEPVAA